MNFLCFYEERNGKKVFTFSQGQSLLLCSFCFNESEVIVSATEEGFCLCQLHKGSCFSLYMHLYESFQQQILKRL